VGLKDRLTPQAFRDLTNRYGCVMLTSKVHSDKTNQAAVIIYYRYGLDKKYLLSEYQKRYTKQVK
jgi:hypothetical protein